MDMSSYPLDPREEVAKRASQYSIRNLDGLAFDDNVFYSLGGFSTVSFGILQLKEEVMIGSTASSDLIRDDKTMKVSLLPNHNFSIYLMGREPRWP